MRKALAVLGLIGALGYVSVGVAAVASTPPVSLSGPTNVHGKKDVSGSTKAKLELEQDDTYFSPTFIKVQPGEQLTITLKNEGTTAHTFTSAALNVDKTVQPDKKAKVRITIPATGGTFEFHCNFHQSMGMHGAFYTGTASGQATGGTTTTTDVATTEAPAVVPVAPQGTPAQAPPAQTGAPAASPAAPAQADPPPPTAPPATSPPQPQPTNPPKPQPPPDTNPGTGGIAF